MVIGRLISKKMSKFFAQTLVFIFLTGASYGNSEKFPCPEDEFNFVVNGDLIFRFGEGLWSKYFRDVSVHEKRFSHVGIITIQSNAILIIHASADDFTGIGHVKEVPIFEFIKDHPEIAIYRRVCSSEKQIELKQKARTYIGKKFDARFSLSSTNEVYCTELVRNVFNTTFNKEVISTSTVKGYEIVTIDNCYLAPEFIKIYDKQRMKK